MNHFEKTSKEPIVDSFDGPSSSRNGISESLDLSELKDSNLNNNSNFEPRFIKLNDNQDDESSAKEKFYESTGTIFKSNQSNQSSKSEEKRLFEEPPLPEKSITKENDSETWVYTIIH